MRHDELKEEISSIISRAKLQAAGFMDDRKEEDPDELAEYIIELCKSALCD